MTNNEEKILESIWDFNHRVVLQILESKFKFVYGTTQRMIALETWKNLENTSMSVIHDR